MNTAYTGRSRATGASQKNRYSGRASVNPRNLSSTSIALLAGAISATMAMGPAYGQSSDDADEAALTETLVVSAHRTPVEQKSVSSAASLIEREFIDWRQSSFAADLLRDLPGVAVSRTGSFGSQTQLRIRGAEANHLLVVIDGVEANDPAATDEFNFASLTTFDVESIELVRGPQSALWGSDATAGIININTRKERPSAGEARSVDGGAFLEGGSFGTWHGGARLSAAGERGDVQASVSRLQSGGTKTAASGSEKDGLKNTTATLRGNWQPNETFALGAFARYTDAQVEFDDFDFTTGLPADADRHTDDQLLLLGASARVSLLDARWTHDVRLTLLDSEHALTNDGADAGRNGAEKRGVYYQSTWKPYDAHQLVVAIDHEEAKFRQRGEASFFGDPNQDQKLHATGYVAEYLGRPAEPLMVSASVRFDDNSDFGDATTFRFTAAYATRQTGTRLRASFGTGQKSPTFIDRFGFFADQFLGNPDLKPERSRGFEIAVDQALADGRISAGIGYFNERLKDEINGFAFDFGSFAFTAVNMEGRSKRQGVEAQVNALVDEHLNIRASYTYTDSTQPNAAGERVREIRRPRHMAALNVNVSALQGRANMNVNISHTSRQTDEYFPPPLFSGETVGLPTYTLVDVAASYQLNSSTSLYARVENLTNENYSDVFGFAAPGRGAYLGVRLTL